MNILLCFHLTQKCFPHDMIQIKDSEKRHHKDCRAIKTRSWCNITRGHLFQERYKGHI